MSNLFVIATPIGNLGDISERALETLKRVDFILCEDTRHSRHLLEHFNITIPLISYHQHSKLQKVDYIISLLEQGKDLALITDAGTPGISDPGGKLVEEVVKCLGDKVNIVPIPGPCAITAALSVSGFPSDKFLFLGFPPHKKGRAKFFSEVLTSRHTVVFYESCHRILRTLLELGSIMLPISSLPTTNYQLPTNVVVCRELTKKFETIYRGAIDEVTDQIKKDAPGDTPKGEFVVLIKRL